MPCHPDSSSLSSHLRCEASACMQLSHTGGAGYHAKCCGLLQSVPGRLPALAVSKEWARHKAAAPLTHLMGVSSGPGTRPPDATWRECTIQRCEPCASAHMTLISGSSLKPVAQLTAMLSSEMHGVSLMSKWCFGLAGSRGGGSFAHCSSGGPVLRGRRGARSQVGQGAQGS